eukprot:gene50476-7977_t
MLRRVAAHPNHLGPSWGGDVRSRRATCAVTVDPLRGAWRDEDAAPVRAAYNDARTALPMR